VRHLEDLVSRHRPDHVGVIAKVGPGGDLDHPARVYLIDADGQIREIYSLAFFDPGQALIDIRSLTR